MLSRTYRGLVKAEIDAVFASGVFGKDENLTVFQKDNQNTFSRFAVIVSKKTARLAVDRNRIKRLVFRALGQLLVPDKNDKTQKLNGDYVLLVKNATIDWKTCLNSIKNIYHLS